MNYYFDNFAFNSQSLILTKAGESLTIRHNESRLLVYFLENPEAVLSKDVILENVWPGKVVSEQAVFQAISNLRVLFGDNAIKTFPKKGYQWQISFESRLPQAAVEESLAQQSTSGNYRWFKSRSLMVLIVLGCFFTVSWPWSFLEILLLSNNQSTLLFNHLFLIPLIQKIVILPDNCRMQF